MADPSDNESATKIPAGLETLYELERHNIKSPLGVLILAVHWSIVRAGLRIPTGNNSSADNSASSSSSSTNTRKYTERLPEGWSIDTSNSQTTVFTFDYVDPNSPGVQYQVKVIEIVRDTTAVVTVYRHNVTPDSSTASSAAASASPAVSISSSPADTTKATQDQSNKTSASTFQLPNFIRFDTERSVQEQVNAEAIFYKADDLEKQIWTELMEPLGLKVIGLPPFQGPYDDKVKSDKTSREREPVPRQPLYIDDPLRDDRFIPRGPIPVGGGERGRPPVGPPGGFGPLFGPPVGGGGGLGRSDLDPLGRIGAGMIADPRGFRTPRVGPPGRLPPGAVPPGARFDPFGPPNPNPGGTMPNWAVPNPDEPPPPGFDDMFM